MHHTLPLPNKNDIISHTAIKPNITAYNSLWMISGELYFCLYAHKHPISTGLTLASRQSTFEKKRGRGVKEKKRERKKHLSTYFSPTNVLKGNFRCRLIRDFFLSYSKLLSHLFQCKHAAMKKPCNPSKKILMTEKKTSSQTPWKQQFKM